MRYIYRFLFIITLLLLAGCASTPENLAGKEEDSTNPPQNQIAEKDPSAEQISASTTSLKPPEGLTLKDDRVGITPSSIEIPAINVNAEIEDVERLENGQMEVPQDYHNVGWFEPGAKPGAPGNAVMAGHVDSKSGPAVFYKLDQLKRGDEIIVHNKDGKSLTYVVVGSESYPRNNAPVEEVFDYSYGSRLNLITCTGEFNHEARTHEERLVVYTELKDS